MKRLNEWEFVGYGVETDYEEDAICFGIAHPAPDETYEEAIARAKEIVDRKIKEREEHERS